MKLITRQRGIGLIPVIAGIAILLLAWLALQIGAQLDQNPESSDINTDLPAGWCPTKCAWFVQKTCPVNGAKRTVGACFPGWGCTEDRPAPCDS